MHCREGEKRLTGRLHPPRTGIRTMSEGAPKPNSMPELRQKAMGWLLGGGIAVNVALYFLQIGAAHPERTFDLAEKWGPLLIPVCGLLFIFQRHGERSIRVQERVAANQESMSRSLDQSLRQFAGAQAIQATSMREIAESVRARSQEDERRMVRTDLLLGELTRTSAGNAEALKRIEEWIDGQRKPNQ